MFRKLVIAIVGILVLPFAGKMVLDLWVKSDFNQHHMAQQCMSKSEDIFKVGVRQFTGTYSKNNVFDSAGITIVEVIRTTPSGVYQRWKLVCVGDSNPVQSLIEETKP
ncbi:hypothetical protein [Limnohabitans sp.]|jgi:hypothetical protein|uniref:hypothetical protein n=1 Tax=Limnohabitans sp. TaxID=1907725 RepID=UPI00261221C1|nr:hypothetical protein [Limnohabitans sp.]